jgi:DNA-binding GntR family transcriptional regulator
VPAARPLPAVSAVRALAEDLRGRILDGELAPGQRLVERELVAEYGVARHTVRSALRDLRADGLVQLEPNRGARVAGLDAAALRGLFDLRMALELEAAHRALARHDGRVPATTRAEVRRLSALCARPRPAWRQVIAAHERVHLSLVRAGGSERITRAYEPLLAEIRLFMLALRTIWGLERTAGHHEALVGALEAEGVPALRHHLEEGEAAALARLGDAAP